MRLYRIGDSGEPVRDIQDRLSALGFVSHDPSGEFGESTATAVVAFQKDRGLTVDGVVGPDTWRILYEAGYRLGDRLLYLRRPMMRGDDVTELQRRLNNLGFDAGKPDGVYGPDTARAVVAFQRDRGITEDGVAGPEVMTEVRLVTRGEIGPGREAVREREWMRSLPRSAGGSRVLFDPAGRTPEEAARAWEAASAAALSFQEIGGLPIISRSVDVVLPERVRVRRANRLGADLIVGFQLPDTTGVDRIFYFETVNSRSEAGALLARALSETMGVPAQGRATPMLRETRAATVIVSMAGLCGQTGVRAVAGVERFFAQGAVKNSR